MKSLTYLEYVTYKSELLGIEIPYSTILSAVRRGLVNLDPEHKYPKKILMDKKQKLWIPRGRKVERKPKLKTKYYDKREFKSDLMFSRQRDKSN